MMRETGNWEDNKTNDNGAVEVRDGELEAAFCPSDDRREVIEDLETNRNLNEDNPLDRDTKLDEENTSEGDEPMDGDSPSKEDDALTGWNDERAENEGACNKIHHILKKGKRNLFAVKQFWETISQEHYFTRKHLVQKNTFYIQKLHNY